MAFGLGGVVGVFSGSRSRRSATGHAQEMDALKTKDDNAEQEWTKIFGEGPDKTKDDVKSS